MCMVPFMRDNHKNQPVNTIKEQVDIFPDLLYYISMLLGQKIRFICFLILITFCCAIPFIAMRYTLYVKNSKKEQIINLIAKHLKNENNTIEDNEAETISHVLYEESDQHGLDYRLILALMKIESNFQQDVVSSRGARGLLQVKPSLAKFIASDLGIKWDGKKTLDTPDANIRIGVRFLSQLIADFRNTNLALKAYNMGPSKAKESSQDNPNWARGFPNLVMNEYKKNITILPNP